MLCTAVVFLFESGGHSRWIFLRHSVSNAELIYLCVHVHVCMIVLGGSGTLLHNCNASQMKEIVKNIWIQPVEQLDRIE